MTFNSIDEAWSRVADDIPPIAEQLKWKFPERWVRIHTLPDSKRYPENDDEIFEVLRKHNTLLNDIATAGESFWLITPHGSEKKDPTKNPTLEQAGFQSSFWISISRSEPNACFEHLFVDRLVWNEGKLNDLLRLVIQDEIYGVMAIFDTQLTLYHPYDGGLDLILSTTEQRDLVKTKYQKWLSNHSRGL